MQKSTFQTNRSSSSHRCLYRHQQDKQPEAVNGAENAIEHDAIDILTEYPSWSAETYDLCDSDEAIYDRNRKEIQSELFKDTPVKLKTISPIQMILMLTIGIELK